MPATIARHCDQCKAYTVLPAVAGQTLICPQCAKEWGKMPATEFAFETCPVCPCRQFYTVKDFNQILGFAIMAIGIVLVPKTYGLSLPVFAFIDWLIYKKVPTIVACYRCGSEFRGFPIPARFKSFMHHIGLKYDKYRN